MSKGFYANGECKLCHMMRTPKGHDPCIANLPGVVFACCGHGLTKGYLKFEDGRCLDFDFHSVDLDTAEHELVKGGTPVYVKSAPPRKLYFKSGTIRKQSTGLMGKGDMRIVRKRTDG